MAFCVRNLSSRLACRSGFYLEAYEAATSRRDKKTHAQYGATEAA
jgi:hypothetical protein